MSSETNLNCLALAAKYRKLGMIREARKCVLNARHGRLAKSGKTSFYSPREWRAIERTIRRQLIVIGGYQPFGWSWSMLRMLYPRMAVTLALAIDLGGEAGYE